MDIELGMKEYGEGALALDKIIEEHFPKDNSDVQQARLLLLESLGYLRYAAMEIKEATQGRHLSA